MFRHNTQVVKKVNTWVVCQANTKVLDSMGMKKMTYGERLRAARKHKKLSQTELASLSGVGQGSISKIERGDQESSAYDVELAFALDVNPLWLKNGNNEFMPRWLSIDATIPGLQGNVAIESNAEYLGGFDVWDDETPLDEDEVALPFFKEIELAAGSGKYEVVENGGHKLRFSKYTLKREGVSVQNAACVTVSGNSMEPVLTDGTTIGIDTSVLKIVDGEMYAIDHDGHLRVKLLYRLPGGGIRLRSYNREEYPDEILSAEETQSLRIIGWVFWISTLRKRRF